MPFPSWRIVAVGDAMRSGCSSGRRPFALDAMSKASDLENSIKWVMI
jgi:hypothetical protein